MDDDVWIALALSTFAGGLLGITIGMAFAGGTYKSQAIERGHAQYCPADGDWAWVGECGK